MGQHGIVQCSCGRVVEQCRCLGSHVPILRVKACPACQSCPSEQVNPDTGLVELWRLAHEDYTRVWHWLRQHFPGFLAQHQDTEIQGSEVIIALLTQYMQADDAGTLQKQPRQEAASVPYY